VTYDQLEQLDTRLVACINEMQSIRSLIVAEKHRLQGPKRAGLYPGQIDNYVEAEDDLDCST
jgi:hypothetical protein